MAKSTLAPKGYVPHGYKKAFSVFVALYPILCLYKAVSRFTIGDALLIAFVFVTLVHTMSVKVDMRFWAVAIFVLYAFVALVFNLLLSPITVQYGTTSLLWRIIKFIFYMVSVFVCSDNALDFAVFRKALTITAVIASLFLLLQYVLYFAFGKVVLGRVPFLTIYVEGYAQQSTESIFRFNFRPSSLFFEPAMFAQYAIVPLTLNLYDKKNSPFDDRKTLWITILLTVAIVLCTSGQGILYLAVAYVGYCALFIKNRTKMALILVLGLLVVVVGYFTVDALKFAVDRLLFNENASDVRLGTYSFCLSLEGATMIWGYGYGTTPMSLWLAGAAYVWCGCGVVGLILAFCIFAAFIYRARGIARRVLGILFVVMFFGTSLFYTYMAFWYFSIVSYGCGRFATACQSEAIKIKATSEFDGEMENNSEIS